MVLILDQTGIHVKNNLPVPNFFFMDQHVPRAITIGLRLRGADVITAFEDGASTMDDSQLLSRAGELDRVLFTQDDDLLYLK
jgi:hypothetical protein